MLHGDMADITTHYGQLKHQIGLIELRIIADIAQHETRPFDEYMKRLEYTNPHLSEERDSQIEYELGKLERTVLSILHPPKGTPANSSAIELPEDIKKLLEQEREPYQKKVQEDTRKYEQIVKKAAAHLSGLFNFDADYRFAMPDIRFDNDSSEYDRRKNAAVFYTHKPLNTRYVIGLVIGEWLYSIANPDTFNGASSAIENYFRAISHDNESGQFSLPMGTSFEGSGNGKRLVDFIRHYCGFVYSGGKVDNHVEQYELKYPPYVAARKLFERKHSEESRQGFKEATTLPLDEAWQKIRDLTEINIFAATN